ncbi:hypothetical protein [Hymenobacter radiodurans]|uniref:hypothetical protein n=1 Tax=Hymenobacter radiodurans TaxID=2496028 RepID=UPI00105881A1|nr:hypothetical protein [Hymenobacter radiodurans]
MFPSTARFAGFVFLGLGGFILLTSVAGLLSGEVTLIQLLAGPICLALGYAMVTSYEGITIDARTKRYTNYNWVAGFRQGEEWLHLPEVVRITVAPFNAAYVMNDSIAPSMTVQERGLYKVLLSIQNSRVGIIAAIEKQDQALIKAENLKQILGVEIASTLRV